MNSDRIFCSIVALVLIIWAGEVQAEQPSSSTQVSAQPVFLISEHDLGTGIKVCFLSNGLQVRLPSEKVCPYPLKAPPFTTEPQPAPASPSPSIVETSKPVTPASSKLIERSKPSTQQVISQPVAQPVAAPRAVNVSNGTQLGAGGNDIKHNEVIEDEIADKAIRRCERIGYKLGTEPFKLCALDQIKILSGLKP